MRWNAVEWQAIQDANNCSVKTVSMILSCHDSISFSRLRLRRAGFILYLAFAALNSITPLAAANEKPTLASSSLRYGSLMVDHWLTVDLVRQIERGLFYYPDPQTARTESDLDRLQQSVVAAELELNHALELYRSLSASNSIE